jgi:hypothetical protein
VLLFGFIFQNNFRNLIRTTKFSVSRPTLFRYCLVFRPLSPATEKPYEQTLFRRLNPQFELSHFYLFLNFFFRMGRSSSRSRSRSRSKSRSRSSKDSSRSRSRSYSRSRSRSRSKSVLGHHDGYDPAFKVIYFF